MTRPSLTPAAVLALSLVASAPPLWGQTIVGTTSAGGQVQLVDLDPGSGVATLIGSPTAATSLGGSTAYDASGNRYFFVDGASTLWVVHSGSGTVIGSGALSGVAFTNFHDLEFDPTGNVLYGLLNLQSNGDLQLVTVDHEAPGIGTLTAVGPGVSTGVQGGTMDLEHSTNDRYYFVDGTNLRHFATASGVVTDTGGGPGTLVQGTEADSDSGALHGLQVNGSDRRIVVINTTTGLVGTTGPDIAGEGLSTAGVETSDSAGDRYYFLGDPDTGAPRVYGIVTTPGGTFGTVASSPLLSGVTDAQNWELDDDGSLPVELVGFAVD